MRKSWWKWLLAGVVLVSMALLQRPAMARCYFDNNPPAGAQNVERFLRYSFVQNAISVPRDAPVGTVIARARLSGEDTSRRALRCTDTNDIVRIQRRLLNGFVSDGNVIATYTHAGLPSGVGIRMRFLNGHRNWTTFRQTTVGVLAAELGLPQTPPYIVGADPNIRTYLPEVEVIKTAERGQPGVVLPANTFAQVNYNGQPQLSLSFANSLTVRGATCSISAPAFVPLGEWKRAVFTGVNAVTQAVDFRMALDCTGVNSAIYMTLTDLADGGNWSDRLSLTPVAESARGISVQVLRNNTPVRFGPDSSQAGNNNQFFLFNAGAAQPTYQAAFQARFIQTASEVTPGLARSAMSMTLSYQ